MQPVHVLIQTIMACSESKDDELFLVIKGVILIFGRRLFFSNGLDSPPFLKICHFVSSLFTFASLFQVYHSVAVPTVALYAYAATLLSSFPKSRSFAHWRACNTDSAR
ncbi:hypothetical protein BsWGS_03367 [Bradybaena similaris]